MGKVCELSAANCKRRVAVRSRSLCGSRNSIKTAPTLAVPDASSAAHNVSCALREKTAMNFAELTPKE
ncbi:MAG: hypothetical protein A3E78_00485 [Alphaproteobacteria bacterium RIFCSPHIGHO2_12_FULL_63_12]|nr:MAG: hypothetical protein A3E78_00485 [Alphaproteobacteria bacterium RIFCSPHIGHO2_12_FULL_63_12]